MSMPTRNDILKCIALIDFDHDGFTSDDLAPSVQVIKKSGSDVVQVILNVPPDLAKEELTDLQYKVETSLQALGGGASMRLILSAHKAAPAIKKGKESFPNSNRRLNGIKKIIAVASGKGGVGKSLVSVNLALALAYHHGLRVGLLDADIYGPSIPHMMGIRGPMEQNEMGMLIPHQKHGITTMSMGYMMEEGQPAIWRAPMVHKALEQMAHQVAWGDLDVLIIDTPPGTGDVQLSLNSHMDMDGAIIVSTPQELALADARRGVGLFQKMKVPILGMVENMSAPTTGPSVFGEGGVEKEANKKGLEFLGRVPLDARFMQTSDAGTPIVTQEPDSRQVQCFNDIAGKLVTLFN